MKRWAQMIDGLVANVVEQDEAPTIAGNWVEVTGTTVGPGYRLVGSDWVAPVATGPTRMTKRSFWSRFPQPNFVAMQAILRSGSPALLAGQLGALQMLVSDSPFVDITLDQTVNALNGPQGLTSVAYPATVTIDGTVLPLRLTPAQAAVILAPPAGDEVFQG